MSLSQIESRKWRVILCDRAGNELQNISPLAHDKKLTEQLNTPASFTFSVDPDDQRVIGLHTDLAPYLDYIRRIVKAYRFDDEQQKYVLKFAGYVWPIDDSGAEDGQLSTVTCFDPLIIMAHRFARTAAGSFIRVEFTDVQAALILKTLVDRTNEFAGPTGLTTTGGVFEDWLDENNVAQPTSVGWDLKLMNEVVNEVTAGMDVRVDPLDSTNYEHGRLSVVRKRGIVNPELKLSWKAAPHNVDSITRLMDPTDAANVLVGVGSGGAGADQILSVGVDSESIDEFMQLEGLASFSDVKDQDHLERLVADELFNRRPPQEAVTLKPAGSEVIPGVDFELGDTGFVVAHGSLRGGLLNLRHRIHGYTWNISDDGDEDVDIATGGEDRGS